jgi:hypothetical protein
MQPNVGRDVRFPHIFPLILLAAGLLWSPMAQGAERGEFEEAGSERGWSELRIYNAGAINRLAWCGATETFLAPLRYGRVQVVNVKARTISILEFGGVLGRLHCSPDGRYIYDGGLRYARIGTSMSPAGYGLRYFDTQTGQLQTVFEGLHGLTIMANPEFVSPQGTYVLGPGSLGPLLTLPGGETLTVIPPDTLPVRWPVEMLFWTKDDRWLLAADLTQPATDLALDVIATTSRQAKRVRHKSHVPGFTPFALVADAHSIYYRRGDNAGGWGTLRKLDPAAPVPGFRAVAKDVAAFDLSPDGTLAFTRIFGVRYKGLDDIIAPDAYGTINVTLPGGKEHMIRKRGVYTVGAPYISQSGRLILLDSPTRGEPFSVFMRDGS